jgi:nucleoside-diphosphate-sugar epimerase
LGLHLITGGAGFIGSHVADALHRLGRPVRLLDDLSTGKPNNIAHLIGRPGVEIVECDLRDAAGVAAAVRGVEVVHHHAARASVPRSIDDPAATHDINVTGTWRLLTAAKDAGVRRFVFAASSAAYGDGPESPKVETLPPRPISPYAAGKLAGEHYCRAASAVWGIETVSLRYFNVFGPRQDPAGQYAAAIPLFISALLAGRPPTVYGDGTQSRDFTYVENVVRANLLAADAPGPLRGEAVNVACGRAVSVNELIDRLNGLLGTAVAPVYRPARPGDVLHSRADISLAGRLLGYSPTVDLGEGLRRTVEWFRRPAGAGPVT